jgi:hypothetical protein
LTVHGIEQPLVAGDQRLAGLFGQRQVGRIIGAALEARASLASLQWVPKYQLNLRIDTKSSFGINSVLLEALLKSLQR